MDENKIILEDLNKFLKSYNPTKSDDMLIVGNCTIKFDQTNNGKLIVSDGSVLPLSVFIADKNYREQIRDFIIAVQLMGLRPKTNKRRSLM